MNKNVVKAIFHRNFMAYFNSPTGYVFIGLFVFVSSIAAFWPNEFFNANLANLDQLNHYLPYILLMFIPAITMSIWADERRQGTDELLLTLPATDFEVVVGKYLSAVAVYSVALMFSLVCNLLLLRALGNPDLLLFMSNYFGYWLVGLAMLATGMVASFLTGNLTVAFILGFLFNLPFVGAQAAELFTGSPEFAQVVKSWAMGEQFNDFGHGVISLSATMYFLMIVAVMLYLCMVMIGRRHWMGGRDGHSLLGHYLVRAVALLVTAAAAILVVETFDVRRDVTIEHASSLSPETVELLRKLDPKAGAVQIEAYVSPSVPENYAQTRLNLLNYLREFEKLGGGKVQVKINSTEPTTDEATRAEQQFGITPQSIRGRVRRALQDDKIFLGAAVRCGLHKVVIPFFYRGLPMEYELIRSIVTVGQAKLKRCGVVMTDAKLFGGFDMDQTTGQFRNIPREPIIDELEKQYEVVKVDANKPIEKFDVLLCVQPSSLPQPALFNLIKAIKNGQPTAIFEDPFPAFWQGVTGTSDEKRGPMGQFGGEKSDIQELWRTLGVQLVSQSRGNEFEQRSPVAEVVWQNYDPYPKLRNIIHMNEFVFIGAKEQGATRPFNEDDPITSGLQEMWFPFPALQKLNHTESPLKFVELITTGNDTGLIRSDTLRITPQQNYPSLETNATHENYCLGAHITGEIKVDRPATDEDSAKEDAKKGDAKKDGAKKDDAKAKDAKDSRAADPKTDAKSKDAKVDDHKDKAAGDKSKPAKSQAAEEAARRRAQQATRQINVVLTPDIDVLSSIVFNLRGQGEEGMDEEFGIHFDNVVYVLNAIDSLAGDDRFIEIRKRRPEHRTLTRIEDAIAAEQARMDENRDARKKAAENDSDLRKAKEDAAEAEEAFATAQRKYTDDDSKANKIALYRAYIENEVAQQKYQNMLRALEITQKHQDEYDDRTLNTDLRHEQNFYKLLAVLVPPIPPFIVAVFVFFSRRAQEREEYPKRDCGEERLET